MGYTIKEAAERFDLTAYTLRYYEKEIAADQVEQASALNKWRTCFR
ncbi:MAG: MerR family DNA-binding transcriptional regulator [Veillonellales bacterium]